MEKTPTDQSNPPVSGQNIVAKVLLFILFIGVIALLAWSLLHFLMPKRDFAKEERIRQGQIERQLELTRLAREEAEQEKILQAKKEKLLHEAKLKKLAELRARSISEKLEQFQSAMAVSEWESAETSLGELHDLDYEVTEVAKLTDLLDRKRSIQRQKIVKVARLLEMARALDNGKYSKPAIAYLDEALLIMPEHPELMELRNKIDAYTTVAKVPEDIATVSEALAELRAGDTILLSRGVYKMPVVISKAVVIQGAGVGETIIECDTRESPALFVSGGDSHYKIRDLTVRGLGYNDGEDERFPLVSVEADLLLENVSVKNSSGHGIAVLAGALTMKNTRVSGCAWDGVSVKGKDSSLIMESCMIIGNYEHGVDFWEGASGKLLKTQVKDSAGSGVVIMGEGAEVALEQVQVSGNQQSGIVINSKAAATLKKVFVSKNRLSGVVIQEQGTTVKCGILVSNSNGEAGYFLDPASTVEGFQNATAEKNKKGKLVRQAFTTE